MAIIEHEPVKGGGDEDEQAIAIGAVPWEDRYNEAGETAAHHLATARAMLTSRTPPHGLLDATPVGQLTLALEALLGMIYTPEEGDE